MVHDSTDVIEGPASLDQVAVRFDEQRLVSDAGLLLTGVVGRAAGDRGVGERQRCGLDPGRRARRCRAAR